MDTRKAPYRAGWGELQSVYKVGLAEALGIRYTVLRKGILSSRDLKEMSLAEVEKLGVFLTHFSDVIEGIFDHCPF